MSYDDFSRFYDLLTDNVEYEKRADYFCRLLSMCGITEGILLDLGCGTGSMSLAMADRGFDVIGVDCSVGMLNAAQQKMFESGKQMLLLNQSMEELDLYGTVDCAICVLDGINHLTKKDDLDKTLKLVHNYLMPDGLFIFDVNGRYKFENIYADRSYVLEEDGDVCIWQNDYNPKTKICNFYITLFAEREDGSYDRYDEEQRERMYTLSDLRRTLEKTGFEFIGAYSDFEFSSADDKSERIYIAARAKK